MFIKKYKLKKLVFFHEENSKNIPKMMNSKKMVKFWSWKTWRSHGKGHGISRAEKSTNPGNL